MSRWPHRVMSVIACASVTQQVGPQTVNHYGQLTSATIALGLAPGAALGTVLSHVKEIADIGALLTLLVLHMDLNIYAFVGMIMLIGIVEKNAIMQIDFALDAERSGLSSEEAIYKGCLIRFRPIMMTTMAALGAVPIAIGYGAGGEARQPLGLVVVGGLLFSQLVTLYLTRSSSPTWRSCNDGCRHGAASRPRPSSQLSNCFRLARRAKRIMPNSCAMSCTRTL